MQLLCPECGHRAAAPVLDTAESEDRACCPSCQAELTIPDASIAETLILPPPVPGGTSFSTSDDSLVGQIGALVQSDRLKLPALPAIAIRLNELVSDPDGDLGEITRLIERDPVITAKLLRLANSAFYRGLREIRSVSQAVGRVGLRTLQTIVLAVAAKGIGQGLTRPDTAGVFAALWHHSLACAVAAREVARACRFEEPDLAFTCGLLHDVGKLVLLCGMDELVTTADLEFSEDLAEEVSHLFHTEVGARALRAWQLPEPLPSVAELHEEPERAPEAVARVVAIVHVANSVAHKIAKDREDGPELSPSMPSAKLLGLSEVALASVEVTVEDLGEQLGALL